MTKAGNSQIMRTIPLLITIFSLSFPAYAQYSGGTGEPNDPYQIATAEDLMLLGETPEDYDKHFILTADIDLDPNLPGCEVINKAVIAADADSGKYGYQGTPFTGTFDGDGHTISHLMIEGEGDFLGLFGQLASEAQVNDLGVLDVIITMTSGPINYVGGLAGINRSAVTRCYSTGMVIGKSDIGGLVGYNSGTIATSYSTGTVGGTTNVGGLVGRNYGSITMSYNASVVLGDRKLGGLVGISLGKVIKCHNQGNINGFGVGEDVGGLLGYNAGDVIDCYNTASVRGEEHVGGLVGTGDDGIVFRCYNTGTVSGRNNVGGLLGHNWTSIAIYCYNEGDVSGARWSVGGLAGSSGGSVINCYSTGSIDGHEDVGGLVGTGGCSVIHCYSTGLVNGREDVGGLIGGRATVIQSFWDRQTSGQDSSAGGTGLTTAEMQDIQTYLDAGWDCVGEIEKGTSELWQIPEEGGYPVLSMFSNYAPPTLQGAGTSESPYLVSDPLELGGIVHYDPLAHYRLVAPIDLADIYWRTAVIPYFAGSFDGNSQTISHLTITGYSILGLFGLLTYEVDLKDLCVVDVSITGSAGSVGGLAGINRGAVSDSHSTGTVIGGGAGGLLGGNIGTVKRCHSTCTVKGNGSAGGLVGWNSHTVTQCYSKGAVDGDGDVGGLVGHDLWGTIAHSYSTSKVNGGGCVGGLVGFMGSRSVRPEGGEGSLVFNCYSAGVVHGETTSGGLVGATNHFAMAEASVWDIQSSGQTESALGAGLTTVEMQTATTFIEAGWDFVGETINGPNDIWKISEGLDYPRLWWEKYGGGSGESNNPYLIYTAEHLNEMSAERNDYNKHFKLMADIDFSGYLYDRAVIAPDMNDSGLQHEGKPFTGVLDGNGHAISNLTIEGHSFLGLFGYLDGDAIVSNLSIESADVNGISDFVGSLAGFNYGNIIGCHCTGDVSGNDDVGGLVGSNTIGGNITNCYSTVTVNGNEKVGGLVGYTKGSVTMCYSTGMVISEGQNAGGLVGDRDPSYGIVTDCFWDTQASGQATSAGGTGKTTAEMQTENTFTDAGWDFMDETANGTDDIWWILEGQDYPRLWWETE